MICIMMANTPIVRAETESDDSELLNTSILPQSNDDNKGENSYNNTTPNSNLPPQLQQQTTAENESATKTTTVIKPPAVAKPLSKPANNKPEVKTPITLPSIVNTVVPRKVKINNIPGNAKNTAVDVYKDSDQDGIPDNLDTHPGEDDFAYMIIDNNHNGIADDLELLLK